MSEFTKWAACWGTATSISDRTIAAYAKDLTLRYPIRCCFDGGALRLRFSNETGTEPVTLQAFAARSAGGRKIVPGSSVPVTCGGDRNITLQPGREAESDVLAFPVRAGETLAVSIYLPGVTQMNSGTLVTGPLSGGAFSYGNCAESAELPLDSTRNTNWYYFLNTVDVLTRPENRALICYGDSITAQSWPDYLALRAWEKGFRNVAVIRRAVSGTRILRQYDCATYAAYGLKGETRFPVETNTAGADAVLIQHGINDIIHPVGTEVNVFRPWSDMPTQQELRDGFTELYIRPAREKGLKVWGGTLLPIFGWRTYAPFRENFKNDFNSWLRQGAGLDGCVDFEAAVRDPAKPEAFAPGFDSGDHLHPSEAAYKAMAGAVPECLLGPAGSLG